MKFEKNLFDGLNERQLKAVEFVQKYKSIKNRDYQEINSVSRKTATRDLRVLVDKKIFTLKEGKGAGAYYVFK